MKRSTIDTRIPINAFVATVVILGLAACAQTQREQRPAPTTSAAPVTKAPEYPEAFDEWRLGVDRQPVAELVKDPEKARPVLKEVLFGDDLPQQFANDDEFDQYAAELLELVESDDASPELREKLMGSTALNGVAGIPVLQFLHAYVTGVPQSVRGKIRHYYFNDDQKSGYLEVDTEVDTLQGGTVHTDKYLWQIAVRPGTYEVVEHSGDPNDPFPGTLQFSSGKLADIAARKLDTKLWATGQGIVVIAVKRNGVLLDPATHPLYVTNADSCIDMMFWGYPPRSELPRQPSYCLGRCAHPLVINTD